jgi:hypothetical protein
MAESRQSLIDRAARLNAEVAKVENTLKETIPIKEWRRLTQLINLLRQEQAENEARLEDED